MVIQNAVTKGAAPLGEIFRWATGIEGSCIPHLGIDEYHWTRHDKHWREDFQRVSKELGCRWLRYSLCWHLIESSPGVYDWTWADERINYARELGINLILDLVHFGVPTWLPDAFGDIEFPVALERFSREFGRRYSGVVRSVCPINEPLITALFSGDVGLWPPHGRGLQSYMNVLSRVSQGLCRSVRALRETMSSVEIVLCDALEFAFAEPNCESWIREDLVMRNGRRHVVLDLVTGRIDQEHKLRPWLRQHGFSEPDLNWFLRNAVEIDVLGIDYYAHSEMELYPCGDHHRQRVPATLAGLYKTVRDYWERYRLPMMITETNGYGDDTKRREWLQFTVNDVRRLRAEGVPVIGYTWWPLTDHLDWDGAMLHHIGRIHHVGIYRLERQPTGDMRREPTLLKGDFVSLIAQGDNAVGELGKEAAAPQKESSRKIKPMPKSKLDFPIIVHCHLRWDGVWQRPQQFLSRLSKTHPVLFCEGPLLEEENIVPRYELRQIAEHPNVTVMQTFFPQSRFHDGVWVDNERNRLLKEALQGPLAGKFNKPVQWFYDPMAMPAFANKVGECAIVYDCMDQLSQFKFAPPEIIQRENHLLKAADVVFCGGRKLWTAKSKVNSNCHFYGCGVEVDHFSKARSPETPIPHDVNFVHKPILGYFGVVDERMDYELITKLADANPDWSIVVVGPLAKVDPNALPCRVNIYWVGRREYAQLPAYTKAFNVCLMPFALNEATEYINPTKALEYMATGTPIVSTAVPDVVSNGRTKNSSKCAKTQSPRRTKRRWSAACRWHRRMGGTQLWRSSNNMCGTPWKEELRRKLNNRKPFLPFEKLGLVVEI
jgi:beta-glucosidase/6-phospho-beta-glucosidase/beta-galactosidase